MTGALALFLAGVLATAAVHKLVARARLQASVARLTGAPPALAPLVLAAAACAEALAAIALLAPGLHRGGAIAAALIWIVYAGALARRRGETLDCGCDLAAHARPVDGWAIGRPAVLAGLAVVVAAGTAPAWPADAPFAALALLALWFAAGELLSLPRLARIRP